MITRLRRICSILFLIVFISTTIFTSAEAGVCGKDKIPNTDEINQGIRLRCGPGWLMNSYVKGFARLNMGEIEKNKLSEELAGKNLNEGIQEPEADKLDKETFGIKGPKVGGVKTDNIEQYNDIGEDLNQNITDIDEETTKTYHANGNLKMLKISSF